MLTFDDMSRMQTAITRLCGEHPNEIQLRARSLRGGLEGSRVLHVAARFRDHNGRERASALVVKRLDNSACREVAVYERLVAEHVGHMAPRLLAVSRPADRGATLYLEWLRRCNTWPWRTPGAAEALVNRLADLHLSTATANPAVLVPTWNYEEELLRSAAASVELLDRCRRRPSWSPLARYLPPLHRIAAALPQLRRHLFAYTPLCDTVIHGDVHPGNVVVRRRESRQEPMLIDWGRARIGSPLEDLSACLQSLGYWEPLARRRHDTLFAEYLSARGLERRLSTDLRAAYWIAGASNALSGALKYHLSLLFQTSASEPKQQAAAAAARDWLRIIRRAAAAS